MLVSSPVLSVFISPQFLREMSKLDHSLQRDRSGENRYLMFSNRQVESINGQFEENYCGFLIHLRFEESTGDTPCFPLEFSFWSPTQPVSRLFPVKKIAAFEKLWETPVR